MNSPILRRSFLFITLLIFCTVLAVGIYSRASTSQKQSKNHERTYEAAKVIDVPKVISGIHGLEITSVSLAKQGTPEAVLSIEVTNKRNKAVMALDFIAGRSTYSGLRIDGLLQEDNPLVIIPPHSLKTFTWSLSAIMEGQTVTLAAAVFDDGKEEGERQALDGIKKARVKFQEKQRAEKAKNVGQR
jgi:hypothetical protein